MSQAGSTSVSLATGLTPAIHSEQIAATYIEVQNPVDEVSGLVKRTDLAREEKNRQAMLRQKELERQQEKARQEEQARLAEQARIEAEEAARPKCALPATGVLTSTFGARSGEFHYGIDIANAIGTPVRSAMDGVVIEAGPASGFGLWVRVRHNDGTITVYGHVNTITAFTGTKVRAGDQIATMGNRGQSTGPHLHFEVWAGGAQKINPLPWLATRGVHL